MKSIVFLSPMCVLDSCSGAAVSVCTWLEWLSEKHFKCQSLTMSLFDGKYEYPFEKIVGRHIAVPENVGKLIRITHKKVTHNIFYTGSTTGSKVTLEEQRRFLKVVEKFLSENRPDIVISYGSSDYTQKLQNIARKYSGKFIFYLANAQFTNSQLFEPSDVIVCPSKFLADYYRSSLNLNPYILRDTINTDHTLGTEEGVCAVPECRKLGFITYINPFPTKGLTLFWQLILLARKERPDITFLAVEGRLSGEQLKESGFDLASQPNVWLIPNQSEIRRVYEKTSVLIFPSFWQEASGRVIAEAQLSGIPVLASSRGGIPEQLNSGGFLFNIPERCKNDYLAIPTKDEVRSWFHTIIHLLDNEEAYKKASEKARQASEYFLPVYRKKDVVEFFESL
ncbi:MAG TPA: hypothetical protein DHM44_07445 [Flexistipes sinusarabici]|uniref:Glycosyl transferase family 1 domain-containing protein n=1 Tax=Flexistipes sinusarabici TaxID=2352 RepID=A0A3D5QCD8_FLESI|nr:hypothetical protein [Flexistipes sinusarabici]